MNGKFIILALACGLGGCTGVAPNRDGKLTPCSLIESYCHTAAHPRVPQGPYMTVVGANGQTNIARLS